MPSVRGMPQSARKVLQEGIHSLRQASVENAQKEAEWLLAHLMGSQVVELYLRETDLPEETIEQFFDHITARANGFPIQYILGETDFCGYRFCVSPGVFIPRPETESLVEVALQVLRSNAKQHATLYSPRLIDLGTGSGCIALSISMAIPTCHVVGVEVSCKALRVAQLNAQRYGLCSRVQFVQGNWAEAICGKFDGIISNPPYIPTGEVGSLPLDVRQEPWVSLDGGEDGMCALRTILEQSPRLLSPRGMVILECGEAQVEPLLKDLAKRSWIAAVHPLKDLVGRTRGLLIQRDFTSS